MRLPHQRRYHLLVGSPLYPDTDYGSQFSEGGLVQDTIQQASNRFKGPAITNGLELGNAIRVNS